MTTQTEQQAASNESATLEQWDHDHVIHPQYAPSDSDRPRVMVKGRGSRLYDSRGREYLDATGGLWLAQVGHGRAELAEVAKAQMEELEFFASFWDFTNEPAARLSHRLIELSPTDDGAVYFTAGGSESNEIAIMMARLFHARAGSPGRTVILARNKAYHGITYAARAATGLDAFHADVGPLPPDFVHLTPPEPYRMDNCTDVCVAELEETIARIGAARIAAMIAEPVMGMAGMVAPPDDYWPRITEVLKQHGILLIFDEVVTAYGRTGTWFAAEHWSLTPDIISTAKGLTSGYLPLGAVLVSNDVRNSMLSDSGFISGFTYNGHPTCCAVALKNLEIIENENLLENARTMGAYLHSKLSELLDLPMVGDVRGFGLMLGLELVKDKKSKEPALELGALLGEQFTPETGVIVRSVANHLIFSPPLVFTREDCDEVAAAVRTMLVKHAA